ncbi:hypothetical protein [Streptomyces sp. LN549]|uniref:hypothetical protein n=1 Tax=Streptomyces sp. LN549 TaxID=3112979 RepID=UPI00371CD890
MTDEPKGPAAPRSPELDALLDAAARPVGLDPVAAERALVAFRTARDEGVHGAAPTRRRDDWRPKARRRGPRSLRTAVAALAASLTVGGVAMAVGGVPVPFGTADDEPRVATSSGAPERGERDRAKDQETPRPATTTPPRPHTPPEERAPRARKEQPETARNMEALCRAYDPSKDRGTSMNSKAWQRLVEAAGDQGVPAWCARLLEQEKDSRANGGAGTAKPHGKPSS